VPEAHFGFFSPQTSLTMNGQIISAPSTVRIPYGGSRTIQVVTTCDGGIPPDSFAYIYESWFQNIGTYQDMGNGYAVATITLTNENETDSTVALHELVYSFWNGDIADDNREITIIYEPRRKSQAL
jgi:hypothetical protein